MRGWARWLQVTAGVAAVFVAVSAIAQAVRQGSWGPVLSAGWIPAVIVAAWPGTYRRCLNRRSGAGPVS
jgi:hypothetical protein